MFKSLLAHKILDEMSKTLDVVNHKYIWLIAGGYANKPGTSWHSTNKLREKFKSEYMHIEIDAVENPRDEAHTFNMINEIFDKQQSIQESQILCDITSGIRPMLLGMLWACGDTKNIIYFPGDRDEPADVYRKIQINRKMDKT